jgi:hypothetical protein
VYVLFGSKEELQLATIEAATTPVGPSLLGWPSG